MMLLKTLSNAFGATVPVRSINGFAKRVVAKTRAALGPITRKLSERLAAGRWEERA